MFYETVVPKGNTKRTAMRLSYVSKIIILFKSIHVDTNKTYFSGTQKYLMLYTGGGGGGLNSLNPIQRHIRSLSPHIIEEQG